MTTMQSDSLMRLLFRGASVINITTGLNPNYPNPPAWGISLYINGKESPVLVVVRGVEYTFNIMASEEHPVYITGEPFLVSQSSLVTAKDDGMCGPLSDRSHASVL
jgi:hypothetical protein